MTGQEELKKETETLERQLILDIASQLRSWHTGGYEDSEIYLCKIANLVSNSVIVSLIEEQQRGN